MGGIPGPVPNKTPEKEGSLTSIPAEVVNVDELLVGEVEIPQPNPEWHDIAIQIYEAQMKSGQVLWMEPSDWSMLYLMCESISRDLNPQFVGLTEDGQVVKSEIPLKGASLSAYLKSFEMLLMAETLVLGG